MAKRKIEVIVTGDASALERAFGRASSAGERMGRQLTRAGRSMTRGVTLPVLGLGAVATKAFLDFDDAMQKSVSIMGDVGPEIRKEMEKTARTVGKTTTFSAKQAAESFFFLASAGLDAKQSIAAMPQVAKLATAGNFDLATATDLVTDAQSALGLKAKDATKNLRNMARVSDVLVKANNLANATVEQFSKSLTTKAGAAAKSLKKDVEETTAVLSAFADQGVKGELAGNALNIVWRDLATASRKNEEEFRKLNVSVFDSAGNFRHTADIVGDLEKALSSMTTKQQRATLAQLGFQDRSVAFITTLLGTSKAIRNYDSELRKAGGTTDEVAQKQLESFRAKLEIAKSRVMDLAIELGGRLAPTVIRAADRIANLIERFSNLDPRLLKVIGTVALLTATIGPVLFVTGKLILLVTTTIAVVKAFAAAFVILNAVMAANPIGAVITALALLAIGLTIAWKKSETFRRIVQQSFTAAKIALAAMFPVLALIVMNIDRITGAAQAAANAISKVTSAAGAVASVPGKIGGLAGKLDPRRILPGRAHGGPVTAGRAFLVGEQGPELFVPGKSGAIIPRVQPAMAGGGQTVVIHNVMTLDGEVVFQNARKHAARFTRRGGDPFGIG